MNEIKFINMLSSIHRTTPFGADGEECNGMVYTMDSFSPEEDFFTFTPPETIGHNMAAAVISDLLACGVKGEFLINTWNIQPALPEEFYAQCARGIEKVLRHYGMCCIGGDLGSTSSSWNWTAVAGGKVPSSGTVRRISSRKIPFDLYLSGPVGDANFHAFNHLPMPEIELRSPVTPETLFATDTSGGFLDALENFIRVNPDLSLHIETIPYANLPELPFPKEFLLIGGVGEYELLYALPRGVRPPEGIYIGSGDFSGRGITFASGGRMKSAALPDYRNTPPEKWLSATEKCYREIFL